MDLEVALLIGAAVVGIVVGILHLIGYVPPRYRRMLKEVQAQTAEAIGTRIEAALARFGGEDGPESVLDPNALLGGLAALQQAITQVAPQVGVEVRQALAAAQEDALKSIEVAGIPPEVTGAIGGTVSGANRKARELKDAVGQGLLGPYGALLSQFMPPLYEYLVENPDMVLTALEMPVIQKLIQKAAAMAGKVTGGSGGFSGDNPFLGSLKP